MRHLSTSVSLPRNAIRAALKPIAGILLLASPLFRGLPLRASSPVRILDPLQTSGLGTGWSVDPNKGALGITIANVTVPGDLPIPIVFRFNASHGQENQTAGVWTQQTTSDGKIYYAYVPNTVMLDRGIFGSIHFGFISSTASQKVPNTNPSPSKNDTYVPKACYVLEDGSQLTADDFSSFATSVGGSFNLPPYFGLAAKAASSVLVNSGGNLATYTASLSDLGNWSSTASSLAAGNSTFQVLMDRDKARILAPLGVNGTWVPILWLDRFGRSVTFSYATYTSGMPSGIADVRTVTVHNGRGKGFQMQWAEPTAGSSAPSQVLARLDYIGIQAPSIQITGYSGVPANQPSVLGGASLAMNPIAGGPVVRPVSITLGNPAGLAAPSWMQLPLPPSSGFTESWPANQTWSFGYDAFQAELSSFSEPTGVTTSLTWQTNGLLNTVIGTANNQYRCVKTATSTDSNGLTLTQTWTWAMPVYGNETSWVTKFTRVWSGSNVVAASTPTTVYTLYPPTNPNFGNAVPSGVSILDAGGTTLYSKSTTYTLVGVDSTLSALSGQSESTQNGPSITSSATLDPVTGVPLSVTRASGNYTETISYAYESHADILEPKRLLTVTTKHWLGSTASAAPVATTVYDPTTWFASKSYADGGTDGQIGTTFTYASGRLTTSAQFATAPLSTTIGVANQTYTRDPASGLVSNVVTGFDIPSSTDSFTVQYPCYDTADRPLQTIDGLGLNTCFSWDARGRALSVAKDGQATLIYAYLSETVQVATQNSRTTTTTMDGFGRMLTRVRGSDGVTERYAYDSNGNLASMTETNVAQTARTLSQTHDPLGRLVTVTPMVGPQIAYAYSTNSGNQVVTATFTPSPGTPFTTVTSRDLWGNVVSATDPMGTVTTATYDALNHPLTVNVTPSGGSAQSRSYAYTGLGILKSRTEPEGGTTTFTTYNAMGKPQVVTQASGRVINLTYDGLGRLWKTCNNSDASSRKYSGLKLVQADASSNGTATSLAYSYDPCGRLSGETATLGGLGLSGWSLGYAYDSAGRMKTVTYPTGRTINYVYDDANNYGRITQVLNGTSLMAVVDYDNWGNRKDLTFGSGASNTWNMTPDGLQIASQTLAQYGLAAITRTYRYDGLNHLTQAGEWSSLTHDALGRLAQATLSAGSGISLPTADGPLSYSYDGYGNNTSAMGGAEAAINNFTVAVPPSTNWMPGTATNGANTGWTFNPNGEATGLGTAIGSQGRQLYPAWDGLGRMTGTGTETFGYLPTGLRSSRSDSQDPTLNRIYAYASAGPLMTEYRQTSASPSSLTPRDVVYLGGLAIAEIDAAGVIHELHSDHLGSPVMVTNRQTGQAEGWQFYGAYGETLLSSGTYVPTTGFTGHVQTDPTGLIYMRGRFYSPAWHRFLNSDQGADPNQLNQFAYCGGSPLMRTDPSGLSSSSPGPYGGEAPGDGGAGGSGGGDGFVPGLAQRWNPGQPHVCSIWNDAGNMEIWLIFHIYFSGGQVSRIYGSNGTNYYFSLDINPPSQSGDNILSKAATQNQINRINRLINSGDAMRAIYAALADWGIDTSNVKYINFDPNCSEYANTTEDGVVTVGPAALGDAGLLGTTLAHEIEVHLNIQAANGTWYSSSMGRNLNEVQAWDYELTNSSRFGLSPDQISEIQQTRTDYYNQLNTYYQQQVNKGNYTMGFGSDFWYWVRGK